ncbi:MAG: M50 family metallopeptidase [Oscillospiraceae bacterium]|nr:M50 family metallopeptidase [Oscillospiraceae bacterium]
MINVLIWVFAFLIFNLIVFAHELGHYSTGRLFGVKINEFAIGMGPTIAKFKKNDTVYSLRSFPIGGFCELEGEEKESKSKHSFGKISVWKRVIVLAAGGLMNLLIGLIFSVILTLSYESVPTTTISGFIESSVSDRFGLKTGDEILSINGYKTHIDRDVWFALSMNFNKNSSVDIEVLRNGKYMLVKNVKIKSVEEKGIVKGFEIDFYLLGVKKTLLNVLNYSVMNIVFFVRLTYKSITDLISGRLSIKDMSGPVGVATKIGEITDQGLKSGISEAILNILSFMTMFTISIGIFNLLPFPALDGGRIIMLIPEAITGKHLDQKIETIINIIGFGMFILLTIAVTYNDIMKIIKGFLVSSSL